MRQINQDVSDLVDIDSLGSLIRLLRDPAASTEPHSIPIFQRCLYRDRHASSERGTRRIGNRDSVGDDYQSRAHASSQLDDSLVALLIMPAMEYV